MKNAAPYLLMLALGYLAANFVSSSQAQSPHPAFRECFASKTWQVGGRATSAGNFPELVRIPPGWTPVGGGGDASGREGIVILCR